MPPPEAREAEPSASPSPTDVPVPKPAPAPEPAPVPRGLYQRLKWTILGAPKDVEDRSLFHRLSLVPLLAWVGLGADGLSSSAYGPEEAFLALGEHTYLALVLALATALTVAIISTAYSRLIEEFPAGGGGYSVSSKLLGPALGVVAGCALIVDYVLTITVSIAAAGDALFSALPVESVGWKIPIEFLLILLLIALNLRGAKESVIPLVPIFGLFVITHVVLIGVCLMVALPHAPERMAELESGFRSGYAALGFAGLFRLVAHSYSLGAGTYTGIEAVSNGLPMMREPRVRSAKRTMLYMACSLAFTAAGLLIGYLLLDVQHAEGRTLNSVLAQAAADRTGLGRPFVWLTLAAEGALLVVAAQTGFLGGPRVLANMAADSWMPRRFAALSERLTTQNGILLVGMAALAALVYTEGSVDQLVVMYAINVFITFALAMFAMLRLWTRQRERPKWARRVLLFGFSFMLCTLILVMTIWEKFSEGAWLTIVVTGSLIGVCCMIHGHYAQTGKRLAKLDEVLANPYAAPRAAPPPALERTSPTACVLVGGYSGIGVHTLLAVIRAFPGYYRNFVFMSVAVVDSGSFKGVNEIDALRKKTEDDLKKFVDFARANGLAAEYRLAVGTEVPSEAESLADEVVRDYPRTTFFAGKVVFKREQWYYRLLHNETGYAVQRRLHGGGKTMVVLPVMVG